MPRRADYSRIQYIDLLSLCNITWREFDIRMWSFLTRVKYFQLCNFLKRPHKLSIRYTVRKLSLLVNWTLSKKTPNLFYENREDKDIYKISHRTLNTYIYCVRSLPYHSKWKTYVTRQKSQNGCYTFAITICYACSFRFIPSCC